MRTVQEILCDAKAASQSLKLLSSEKKSAMLLMMADALERESDAILAANAEDIKEKSVAELDAMLDAAFSFDNFKWQQENNVRISEKFRADHLDRVLYKCPHCMEEGKMEGKGIHLTCNGCGKKYELTEYGFLKAVDGESKFTHIPDWYRWERDCVREEILSGRYSLRTEADIYMLVNTKRLYRVGEGVLEHTADGFHLTGCDGQLDYSQKAITSYCLYSDYYWYEIGDMISIGNTKALYYCFPKDKDVNVSKARLAAEEIYKLSKKNKTASGSDQA